MKDKRTRTHEEYLKILEEKNIKIKPLERYITSRVQILHKCFCGKKWLVKPNAIVTGQSRSCGCANPKKQLTNKKYLQKLKELNIKVKPLEEYHFTTTKIDHLCVCGNIWNAEPKAVLKGHLCGCRKTDNNPMQHEEYLKRLKEKDIKIIPLEKYINKRTKIKHLCICGTKWKIRPDRVINGSFCGCTMSKEEAKINRYLEENDYDFTHHKAIKELKFHPKGKSLEYDFAIYKNGKILVFIEYHGKHHYEYIPFYNRNFFSFLDSQERDRIKCEYAKQNNIPLIEIHYSENTIVYLENELKKLNII